MSYKKLRYNDTDIHVYEQTNETLRLLQHEKLNPLSYLRDEKGNKPKAVINCSYFTSQYVLGRNQGDLYNNTHDQNGFYDLVFLKNGTYKLGQFKSWDYTNKDDVLAGFSVATVLIKDGKECGGVSVAIASGSKLIDKNPQTAIGVLKDGNVILVVSDGRTNENKGLTGYELRTFLKQRYELELLCQLDGGGSSEMIVDGAIMNEPSDGKERLMLNGLALLDNGLDDVYETELKCPFKRMNVTQYDDGAYSHKGANAWDIASGTAGVKDPYFAPCQLKCKAIDTKYAFTWWQSTQKVKFADGTIDYVTMMFGHDNVINAKVGMVINEGTQIGNMGTGGNATGVHCHIEVAKGTFKNKWIPNEYGVYVLPNAIKFYDAFFMDDVELIKIKDEVKAKFKYLKKSELDECKEKVEELEKEIKELNDEISKLKANLKACYQYADLILGVSKYED